MALVRYVKRANADPDLGVLIPVVKTSVECFYFNKLPFLDDVRNYRFGTLAPTPADEPTKVQRAAAAQLIEVGSSRYPQERERGMEGATRWI